MSKVRNSNYRRKNEAHSEVIGTIVYSLARSGQHELNVKSEAYPVDTRTADRRTGPFHSILGVQDPELPIDADFRRVFLVK